MPSYKLLSTKELELKIVDWFRNYNSLYLELIARNGRIWYDSQGFHWAISEKPNLSGTKTGFEHLSHPAFEERIRLSHADHKDLFRELRARQWKLRIDGVQFLQIFIPDAQSDFSDLPTPVLQ